MRSLLISFLIAVVVFLGSSGFSRAQSQNEMNQQAWAEFEKADKELNELYQKILKTLDDDVTKQKFIAAQKAWLKFRDAEAAFVSDEMRGGSAEPMLQAGSQTETTKARIAQFKDYLANQSSK